MNNLLIETVEYLQSGGGVIIPLVVISVWMWGLIITKLVEFYRWRNQERSVLECVQEKDSPGFSAAPWQIEILQSFMQYRTARLKPTKKDLGRLQRLHEMRVDRHVKTILVLAAITPLLGLLGTVVGMIKTFDVISLFGTGNARAMASGISEALITTQTGLVVAVPGLILGSFISRRAERIRDRIHYFSLGLLREL